MTHAYSEYYLEDAMSNFGAMLDCAVHCYDYTLNNFYQMFLVSGIDRQFAAGNPRYICGLSGVELTERTIELVKGDLERKPYILTGRSPEYWTGWVLAYFQWHSGYSFQFIQQNGLDVDKIRSMYSTLHEADLSRFVNTAYTIIRKHISQNKVGIKHLRLQSQLTQQELAKASGVTLRMIQAYEQNRQDIGKAEARSVLRLARVLGCRPEDLCLPFILS